MKKIFFIALVNLLIGFSSCKKSKLSDALCDCANSSTTASVDTVQLTIPNIFSPNGDGLNDNWYILNLYQLYSSTVRVKKGKTLIFESSDATIGWDGTYNGKIQKDGAYTYEIITPSLTITGKVCVFSGNTEPKTKDCLLNCTPLNPNDPTLQ